MKQHTLGQAFTFRGVTLHRGLEVSVRVVPAPVDSGRVFVRTDLAGTVVPATADRVRATALATALVVGETEVQTIEHLMSALFALGVDNCRIEIDGPEVPILDGSARSYVEFIRSCGLVEQSTERRTLKIEAPLTVYAGESFVAALPSSEPGLRLSYAIAFAHPAIGQQWHSFQLAGEAFAEEIAGARTFTLLEYVETLRSRGLIQGGSLECALVLGPEGWIEPPTWLNEPVRHKLLDLTGDLALTGLAIEGHIVAYKAGHTLHGLLAQQLLREYEKQHGSLRAQQLLHRS